MIDAIQIVLLLAILALVALPYRRSRPTVVDPAPASTGELSVRARALVVEQDQYEGRSGEAKRHQVYARLIKEFPVVSRRQLSRAIEEALD